MSIAEKFVAMEYGPAPEDPKEVARPGSIFMVAASDILSAAPGSSRPKADTSIPPIRPPARSSPTLPRDRRRMSTPRSEPRAQLYQNGRRSLRTRELAISTRWREPCRSIRAASPCWRRWTTASRFARAATSTFRWLSAISITTPDGHSCCDQEFPGYTACGVVGQIIPWNFPLLMLAWKIAPALATGNTVVLKPAEFTPLTALAFAEICQEVGLPPGVVNIVTGDGSTGEALVKHPDVDKIAFTGSTEVGRAIRSATASSHKRLSLELGGKSPFIIFEDADLDSAVEGLVDGIWFNQGQVCCAGSRLLMQESIAEPLIAKVRDRMSTLRAGPPLDKSIDIGAIVARVQLDRIKRLVDQGVAEGATCWQPQIELPSRGLYYPPTLLSNVHPTSIVAQQEIFGPVLATMTFRTPSEAVELANNTVYGLAACVWSESINVALHVASQLKAGVVWVNCTNLFDASCGFGGYRESGYGREGGREGLLEYLEPEWFKNAPALPAAEASRREKAADDSDPATPAIDRTVKLYIGGKQARPDSGYSMEVRAADGRLLGEAPLGNRKDIRNAVEAAHKASALGEDHGTQPRAGSLLHRGKSFAARRRDCAPPGGGGREKLRPPPK